MVMNSYDFYAGDRSGSVQSPDYLEPPKTPVDDQLPEMEDGQALELIELANGETIWCVVIAFLSYKAKILMR